MLMNDLEMYRKNYMILYLDKVICMKLFDKVEKKDSIQAHVHT